MPTDKGDTTRAGPKLHDARAHALDDACNLGPRRERQRRGDLVLGTQQKRIEKGEPGGLDANDGLARRGVRLRHIFNAKSPQAPKFLELRHAHGTRPLRPVNTYKSLESCVGPGGVRTSRGAYDMESL